MAQYDPPAERACIRASLSSVQAALHKLIGKLEAHEAIALEWNKKQRQLASGLSTNWTIDKHTFELWRTHQGAAREKFLLSNGTPNWLIYHLVYAHDWLKNSCRDVIPIGIFHCRQKVRADVIAAQCKTMAELLYSKFDEYITILDTHDAAAPLTDIELAIKVHLELVAIPEGEGYGYPIFLTGKFLSEMD